MFFAAGFVANSRIEAGHTTTDLFVDVVVAEVVSAASTVTTGATPRLASSSACSRPSAETLSVKPPAIAALIALALCVMRDARVVVGVAEAIAAGVGFGDLGQRYFIDVLTVAGQIASLSPPPQLVLG